MNKGKQDKTFGNFNKSTMITAIVITIIAIGSIGYYTIFYKPSPSGPPTIPATSPANIGKQTDPTTESTETTSELINTTSPEPEISNITDTSTVSEDELNATQPEIPEPDSAIITMNVSDLHDLYIDAYFTYDRREAKDKIENLTGKVIRVRGVFRMSARKKAENNETYEIVILFGTNNESNPKDIFIYLPFTEEVLQEVAAIKYPDVVVVQGEFYPGPPEPLPFYPPKIGYSIVARLKNCQLVP